MQGFVFRLIPPRPTFTTDMTEEERQTMGEHAAYWTEMMEAGKVLLFGPVADPNGPYGLGIVLAEDLGAARALSDKDPAVIRLGMRTDIAPMVRLVSPTGLYG